MDKKLIEHWLEILQTPNWEEHMKYCGPSEEMGVSSAELQLFHKYNKLHKEIHEHFQEEL